MVLCKKQLEAILDAELYRRQHNIAPTNEQIIDQTLTEIDNILSAIDTIKSDPSHILDLDQLYTSLNRIYVLLKALQYSINYESK